jgi:type VI protein secretion system component VasF
MLRKNIENWREVLYAEFRNLDDFFPPGVQTLVGEGMNTSQERERVQKTTIVYIVVMVLIVVLILIAVQDPKVKTIAIILVLLVGLAAIVVQWLLLGKQGAEEPQHVMEKAQEAELAEEEAVSTQTGATCVASGQYHCQDHPDRTVAMEEGKRFPPCRGDNKGHSATWVLAD